MGIIFEWNSVLEQKKISWDSIMQNPIIFMVYVCCCSIHDLVIILCG